MATRAIQINEMGYQLSVHTDIGDELAAVAYLTLKDQGLLDVVFYEGEPSLRWFLDWFHADKSVVMGCFATPIAGGPKTLTGLGWLTCIRELKGIKRSEIGMVFFRDWQRDHMPEEWCDQMIDMSFEHYGMSAVYGTTPEPNRLATMFSKRLGFVQYGPIPMYCSWKGEPCGAVISVMTREMWEKGRKGA